MDHESAWIHATGVFSLPVRQNPAKVDMNTEAP